jgi:hypothetical protein
MYKFNKDPAYALNESLQANPIRWQVLYREKDTFTPQTAQFRCKDYLNDLVAKYRGYSVQVYGMDTEKFKLNEDGVWLRLFNILSFEEFVSNINCCVNALVDDVPITLEKLEDSVLMFIPKHFFSSSYKISLAAYLIRISNNKVKFSSFEEALKSKVSQGDGALRPKTKGNNLALMWKFDIPEDYQQYWWYANNEYNSVHDSAPQGPTIHNNGVQGWAYYMPAESFNPVAA